MDSVEKAKFDQLAASIADTFPSMWRRLYDECLKVKFTEDQAFKLLLTNIISLGGGTVKL